MNLEYTTSMSECYITRSGKRIIISLTSEGWNVFVRMPGTNGEEIATRCSKREALQIAREQYYAR